MDTTSAGNWNVSVLLDDLKNRRHDSGYFHQLLRHLRLTENRAWRTGWARDLGHCDNLLGGHSVMHLHEFHQLVHHLRHRHIENLQERRDVDDVHHGVPLNLLLRPRLQQCRQPLPTCGPAIVRGEFKVLGRIRAGCLLCSQADVLPEPPTTAVVDVRAVASNAAVAVSAAMRLRVQSLAVRCLLFVLRLFVCLVFVLCSLFFVLCSLFIVHCFLLLFVVCCLLFVLFLFVCCLLFVCLLFVCLLFVLCSLFFVLCCCLFFVLCSLCFLLLFVVCCLFFVLCCCLLFVVCSLFFVLCSLFFVVVCCLLFVLCSLLFVCCLFVVCCLLFVCLFFVLCSLFFVLCC